MKILKEVEEILKRFPKKRSKLPSAYKKIYESEYRYNREGIGFIGQIKSKLENWMHIRVASVAKVKILEVGAGTLNHVEFEKDYKLYDVIEPMSFLYKGSETIKKIDHIFGSSEELKEDTFYTHILSIAVFEHMTEMPLELTRLVKKLENGGVFQVAIPTEGSLFWYFSWRFITGSIFYAKYKLNYKTFMKHEHVNNSEETEILINYLFNDVKVVRFPFNIFHLSFYTYIEARDVNTHALQRVEDFYKHKIPCNRME